MTINQLLKSKTLWVSLAAILTGVGLYMETGDTSAILTAVFGLASFVMRFYTSESLSNK